MVQISLLSGGIAINNECPIRLRNSTHGSRVEPKVTNGDIVMLFKTSFLEPASRALALVLLFGWTSIAHARQDVVKDQFEVRDGGTLYVDLDYGDVKIRTHKQEAVLVVMERDVDGVSDRELKELLSRQNYVVKKDGDDVIVEVQFDEDANDRAWKRWKREYDLEVDVEIIIPERYHVEFRTGAGNVDIEELEGDVSGRTGAGNLEISRISGEVDVTSGAGNVEIADTYGNVHVESGAGTVELDDIRGRIEASTGAGNITATIEGQLAGDSSFRTGAGNVVVYLADDVEADVEGRASLGNARSEFDVRSRGRFMSKSFSGRINGGGPAISMSSGVGNVSLRRN